VFNRRDRLSLSQRNRVIDELAIPFDPDHVRGQVLRLKRVERNLVTLVQKYFRL
jgi:hypothetical protein